MTNCETKISEKTIFREGMFMNDFTKEELEEALRAITSALSKSEKAQLKLKTGTFQHTMTVRGIKAYEIAIELINGELGTNGKEELVERKYHKEELEDAFRVLDSFIKRVEKLKPKFETGTSQHTLAVRRIRAFVIATELIEKELIEKERSK